ncbi:MAG: AAA family ATPase, partial [Bacteroidetes bacterium]|nr:AAA family ATPase [Bacteroidota bacterium]
MLKHLYIRNYALFEETQVDFPEGLTILTGETGAGKSMLIGALGLIIGKRADNSVIFLHEDKCIIEARFGNLGVNLMKRLEEYPDFDLEDGDLIIRREIRPNGKSRAFINDTPVSLQVLKEVSTMLLDLHAQHESHSMLAPENQIDLVDAFADADELVASFSAKLKENQKIDQEIKSLQAKENQARQQLDYINFQIQELEAAGLQADEEEQLEQELNLLQNAEEVKESLGGATELLYHQELSLYNQLSEGIDQLKKIAKVSSKIAEEISRLVEAQNTLKEAAFLFQDMLETTESDPERLAFIEERLAVYHKLKLKYKARDGAELVALFNQLQGQLDEFNSLEETIEAKKKQSKVIKADLIKIGLEIEAARNKARIGMEKDIIDFLTNVGFNKARFEVAVERTLGNEGDLWIDDQWVKPSPKGIN